jgi:hypothetical protein
VFGLLDVVFELGATLTRIHINPYGIFRLDMNARLPIDPTESLAA